MWLIQTFVYALVFLVSSGRHYSRRCRGYNTSFCVITVSVTLTVCCTNLISVAAAVSDLCQNNTISIPPPVVFVNESVSLICTSHDYNSKDMHFERNGADLNAYTHILNTSTIQLTYPVTNDLVTVYRSLNLICAIDLHGNGMSTCIGNRRVRIDYYPVQATNIECRIYNWQRMRCWWDLGIEYNHPNTVTVICDYATMDNVTTEFLSKEVSESYWRLCPQLERTSCTWDEETFMDPYKQFHLLINVTNTLRPEATVSVHKIFYTDDLIQLDDVPGDAIEIDEVDTPHCLVIRWPAASRYRTILYNLDYSSPCDSYVMRITAVRYNTTDGVAGVRICDIQVYSVYQFGLKGTYAKVIDGQLALKGFWSGKTTFTYTTKREVPSHSPLTSPGLFERLLEPKHNIRLYWKPLEPCELHSAEDTVNYLVSVHGDDQNLEVIQHPMFNTKLSVPETQATTVTIQARNDVGTTKDKTNIFISPKYKGLSASSLIVEVSSSNQGLAHARIEKLHDTTLNHTIVWCLGSTYCQEQIYWRRLPFNVLETKLDVSKGYRFGLITEYSRHGNHYSTGIIWESCLYQQGKVPLAPPKSVHKSDLHLPESFRLEWSPYDCTEGYINYYLLTYCKVTEDTSCTCNDKEVHVKIPKHETSYTVTHLPVGSYVCAWLNGVSAGRNGPQSYPVTYVITAKKYSQWIWIGPVLAVIVLVGAVLLARFLCRRYQRRLEDVRRIDMVPIYDHTGTPLIENTTILNNVDGQRNENSDSGRSSMSNPSHSQNSNHYDKITSDNIQEQTPRANQSENRRHRDQSQFTQFSHLENNMRHPDLSDSLTFDQSEQSISTTYPSEPRNDSYTSSSTGDGLGSYQIAQNCSFGIDHVDSYSKAVMSPPISCMTEENVNLNSDTVDTECDDSQTLLPNRTKPSVTLPSSETDIVTNVLKHLPLKESSDPLSDIDEDEDSHREYNLDDIASILDN